MKTNPDTLPFARAVAAFMAKGLTRTNAVKRAQAEMPTGHLEWLAVCNENIGRHGVAAAIRQQIEGMHKR